MTDSITRILNHPGSSRYTLRPGFTRSDLEVIRDDPTTDVVQITRPLTPRDYDAMEQIMFSRRPDIEFRAYGWGRMDTIDLSFLRRIPSAERISIDSLVGVVPAGHGSEGTGLEIFADRSNLRELRVGIFDLTSFDFLDYLPTSVRRLTLGSTRSKKPSIAGVRRLVNLDRLYVEGHSKGIDAIGELPSLTHLTLRSISTPNVDYLRGLRALETLTIELGGISSFDAVTELPKLRILELILIRGLADISFISRATGLEKLSLNSLRNVTSLPDLSMLPALHTIGLEVMRGLTDMSSLEHAHALVEFMHIDAATTTVDMHRPLLRNPHLKYVRVGFGSDVRNNRFKDLARESGKEVI